MAKNQKNNKSKYMIKAKIQVDGTVQRKDVVGALFGQCEGLLGDELDLRKLQRTTKIGMIEVNLQSNKGKVSGEINIPSSLDNVETAIIGAAISTIDRIGPCKATINVAEIQDIRVTKRTQVVEIAKDLLLKMVNEGTTATRDVIDEVRAVLTTEKEKMFHGLTSGPNVESSDSLIIMEGRNDVRNVLSFGIKNAISADGAGNIKPELIELANKKATVIVAIDGDRGGEMLLRELHGVLKVDFVAQAPVGQEWELLAQKTVTKCLSMKEPIDKFMSKLSSDDVDDDSSSVEAPAPPEAPTQIKDYATHISSLKTNQALFVYGDDTISAAIGATKLAAEAKSSKDVLAIVFNGKISNRTFEIASEASIPTIIGTSLATGLKAQTNGVEAWSTTDFE